LGVSLHQLEKAQRGFSFSKEGLLDMRMDPTIKITAADLINNLDKRRLYEILKTYGQEKLSRSIVDAIYRTRQIRPIKTTAELAGIVEQVYQQKKVKSKLDPATKAFLALRIVVNSELLNLEEALPQAVELLERGGRLTIISFHSLEDGIVKRFFKQEDRLKVLTKKPVGPGAAEILKNPRSRSAKLRVAQKL
ncbi:16S rRNA (cytosine(1402)-N(4))-methyltransferase RsmH, partial [Candidatus Curtissbacteria bacterium]|nr:16S rRNA (cytosine(1402)-N(4))-methyltransferase RsmH [Candidatus Curtissbacteria bacterium]